MYKKVFFTVLMAMCCTVGSGFADGPAAADNHATTDNHATVVDSHATTDGFIALGVEASTLGPGAKLGVKLTDSFNLRFGANGFTYRYNGKESDVDYQIDLKWLSFPALVDWFPFGQGFRATAGLIVNENKVNLTARPSAAYKVGDTVYTAAQAGTLIGDIKFRMCDPYAGVGWGNPFGKSSNWTFCVDLGVMFHGTPKVHLDANGTLATDQTFQADLARERDDVQRKVKKYQYYPVAAIGVAYKF